jgi:DNA repair protein RadC
VEITMKHYIRSVSWRFSDCTMAYPGLPKEQIFINNPQDVVRHFRLLFKDQVRERFIVLWLNSANRVTGFEIVTEGILNSSLVHPREVFRGAIVATCAAIIIAHNHPSGNTIPSREDLNITKQIKEAGQIIGIPLHDHIIFAEDKFYSFAEQGII